MPGVEELADRLAQLAEELGDLALDRLRSASESAAQGSRPDPAFLAEERRITRARRAVDKAVMLLRAPGTVDHDPAEGSD